MEVKQCVTEILKQCAKDAGPPFKMYTETEMEMYRYRTFWTKEPETIAWIDSFGDGNFFDVGANIGVYSLYSKWRHPEKQIYAFEPVLENYHRLVQNIELNGYNIVALPLAVDDVVGIDHICACKIGESGVKIGGGDRYVLKVSLDFFQELCEWEYPVYLKIDIDGEELDVLYGAKVQLETKDAIKSILVEVENARIEEVTQYMNAYHFTPDPVFNEMRPHSSERRRAEGINVTNIVFKRA